MPNRFNVSDLNAIETRVGAWVSNCQPLLKVFEQGKDPYLDFATKMTDIPYEKLAADMKSKDAALKGTAKRHRQIAKPGVLGCIYRLSAGGWGFNKYGDRMKVGLWGYSENMGIEMSIEQAQEVVKVFRKSYIEITWAWYALERMATAVVLDKPLHVSEDDDNIRYALAAIEACGVSMDKITINDHGNRRQIFRIMLPAGRYLHYLDADIQDTIMPWKDSQGEDVYKPTLVYSGVDQESKQWKCGITSHGGKLFENIVQGIARDVLAESLLKFEEIELPVCGHVHDEGITETEDDPFLPGVREMEHIMSQPIVWAPGLPLKADGFESAYYHK